jgi:hypothetical protein
MGELSHGMDLDAVEDLGRFLKARSADLDALVTSVDQRIRTTSWTGDDAAQFAQQWWPAHRTKVTAAAESVGGLGQSALNNVMEQRRASASAGGPRLPSWREARQWVNEQLARVQQLRQERLAEIDRVSKLSAEEQAAWWNALSPAEQQALIALAPLALLALPGLPASARQAASEAAVKDMEDSLVLSSEERKLKGEISIKVVRIQAGVEAEIREYADGHVEVVIRGEAGAGVGGDVGGSGGSIMLNGNTALTYTFDDGAAADAFLDGLLRAPLPDDWGDAAQLAGTGAAGVMAPSAIAAYGAGEVKEYLDSFASHQKSASYGGEIAGEVKVNVAGMGSVELNGEVGGSWDSVSRETTLYLKAGGDLDGGIGPFTGDLSGDTGVELVLDEHGDLKSLSFSGDYEGSSGISVAGGSSSQGGGGSFEMKVDLTDPAVRQSSLDLVRSMSNGDTAGVSDAMNRLYGRSEVVISETSTSSQEMKVGVGVAEVSGSSTTSTTTSTYVKPPGGVFIRAAGGGGGSSW